MPVISKVPDEFEIVNVLPHIDQKEPFQFPDVVPLILNVIVSYVYKSLPPKHELSKTIFHAPIVISTAGELIYIHDPSSVVAKE